MFQVYNVKEWLSEVINGCNKRKLDPEDAVFLLLFFSSLDSEFVSFFRDRNAQISQFSGKNFHIITPTIYDDLISDDEWRTLRNQMNQSGICLSNKPFTLLFTLEKRRGKPGYKPEYFSGFEFPSFEKFNDNLRDIVELGIVYRHDTLALKRELAHLLKTTDFLKSDQGFINRRMSASQVGRMIDVKLHAPRFFISYSHADSEFVIHLYEALRARGVDLWVDAKELGPGMRISTMIDSALRTCDGAIVVLSKNSIQSEWVRFEGASFYGANRDGLIIPVLLDEQAKNDVERLPFLKDRMSVDFSDSANHAESLNRLEKALWMPGRTSS